MTNLAVYTAVFGDYDVLHPVPEPHGKCDYICFTDTLFDAPAPWQVRVVEPPHANPRKAARYFLLQSTLVLPEYEYTIMHGGNAVIFVEPVCMRTYVAYTDIAAFKHPHRKNVYTEPQVCDKLGKDKLINMQLQMARYKAEGFAGEPFSACTLLVRHNTPALAKFEQLWWSELLAGSHRDQLSFDYCRWRCNLPITYIPGDPYTSLYLRIHGHVL